jgi:lysozyme family protein
MSPLDRTIAAIIKAEGGDRFTNNPADPGGATKFGITARGLAECWGRPVSPAEIASLTDDDAYAFYRWLAADSKIDQIPNEAVLHVVFDAAVNMGRTPAIRLLQRALGVKADGVIGPVTLAAVPHLDGLRLARIALAERMEFYGRLAAGDLTDADKDGIPDRLEFLPGWLNRVGHLMRTYA